MDKSLEGNRRTEHERPKQLHKQWKPMGFCNHFLVNFYVKGNKRKTYVASFVSFVYDLKIIMIVK